MYANQRRKTNKISQVIDPDGYLVIDPVGDMFFNYYSQLFASSNPLEVNLCVQAIPYCISKEYDKALLAKFS